MSDDMQPTLLNAFRDPRFLLTMLAIAGTAYVAYYRLGQLEINQEKAIVSAALFQSKVDLRVGRLESYPRYTLEDDEKRMAAFSTLQQRELDRRQLWMDEQNKFRLQMVQFAAETRGSLNAMKLIISELREQKNP